MSRSGTVHCVSIATSHLAHIANGVVARVPSCRSRRLGFDSRRYHIFWDVVGLERGPPSLVSTTEELLGRKSNGSGLESREYGHTVRLTMWQPLSAKVGTNCADKRRLLSQYNSLEDTGHGVCFLVVASPHFPSLLRSQRPSSHVVRTLWIQSTLAIVYEILLTQ
jgi:hypothetical protein